MRADSSKRTLWIGVGLVLALVAIFYQQLDLGRLLTLDSLKNSRDSLVGAYQGQPLLTLLVFFGVYVSATALSLPGAFVLTLAAGAMFGPWVGLVMVSFASSLGALLAFLGAAFLGGAVRAPLRRPNETATAEIAQLFKQAQDIRNTAAPNAREALA